VESAESALILRIDLWTLTPPQASDETHVSRLKFDFSMLSVAERIQLAEDL